LALGSELPSNAMAVAREVATAMQERFGYDALAICRHEIHRAATLEAKTSLRLVLGLLKEMRAKEALAADVRAHQVGQSRFIDKRRSFKRWRWANFIRLPFLNAR
jgi:hypothetical protein